MSVVTAFQNQEPDCKVRLATEADESSLKSFLRKQRQAFQSLLFSNPDADLDCLEAFYNNRDGFIFILEIEKRIVGTIALFPVDERRCELRKLYLEPEISGGGLGQRLLSMVIRLAEERDFQTMQLETHPTNINSYALYANCGFRPAPKVPPQFVKGGRVLELSLTEEAEQAC